MKSTNTQNMKIDWKHVNRDNTEKLKSIKRLIKEYDSELPPYFVLLVTRIIDNE